MDTLLLVLWICMLVLGLSLIIAGCFAIWMCASSRNPKARFYTLTAELVDGIGEGRLLQYAEPALLGGGLFAFVGVSQLFF